MSDVYYNIVCLTCDTRLDCRQIDGYPLDWQPVTCPECGGLATPDLENPYYITDNEARLRAENEQLKRKLAKFQEREFARGRAYEWVSPIPDR